MSDTKLKQEMIKPLTSNLLRELAEMVSVFFEQLKNQIISKKEYDERLQLVIDEYSNRLQNFVLDNYIYINPLYKNGDADSTPISIESELNFLLEKEE